MAGPEDHHHHGSGGGSSAAPSSNTPGRHERSGRRSKSSSGYSSKTRVSIGHYLLGKTLGIGSFGKVKLAEHMLTGQLVAIKILNRSRIRALDMEEKVRREIQILRLFVHPHIIRLYEVIETPTDIFLVMEYVSGGELFDFIVSKGRLHVAEARQFFQQIISGVAYCHNSKVVHRDLKPENLLLSGDYNVKVADFGLSNLMHDGEFLRTSCGSPNYAAPEVISGNLYAGPEVDIWSCGVILYALLVGSLPFDDEAIPKLFKKIRNGQYVLPSHLDETSRDLITKMLVVDPTQRIKIEEIRAHPFFLTALPPYLALPINQQTLNQEEDTDFDEECIEKICLLKHPYIKKYGKIGVIKALNSKRKTFIKVIYVLYLDQLQAQKRVAQQRATANRRQEEMTAIRSVAFSPPSAAKSAPGPSRGNYRGNYYSESPVPSPKHGTVDGPNGGAAGGGGATGGGGGAGASSLPGPYGKGGHPRIAHSHGDAPPGSPRNTSSSSSTSSQTMSSSSSTSAGSRSRSQGSRTRKWYLGIQSKKDPELVMSEVFRALKSLRSQWHYVPSTPYKVLVRWRPSCLGIVDKRNLVDDWVYVALQLYKVQTSIYLLDFQRTGGISGCFSFMRLCSLIINALKAPNSVQHHHHQLQQQQQQQTQSK